MAIYHHHFEQRSAEWFNVRAGIPTASEFERIITPTGKASTQATGYMNRLLAEWVLGRPIQSEVDTQYMQDGRDYEAAAVRAFEFQTQLKTSEVGFVTTDDGLIGCSPDRLVSDQGTLEIKCPAPQTQISYLLDKSVADKYRVQTQAQIWICERDKSWVESYHPELPNVILEIQRDDEFIVKISCALRAFVETMLQMRLELERKFGPFTRPEPANPSSTDTDLDRFGITEADLEWISK